MGTSASNSRQLAFLALRAVHRGAYADVALDRVLQSSELTTLDRRLVTELVYGSIRRQRTLNALIDQFANKPHQPSDLRLILQLGFYQLRYLTHIPPAAAVNTTVDLAKQNGFSGLAGVVNGILRQYDRAAHPQTPSPPSDPLHLPADPIARLATLHSFPDWIVRVWFDEFGAETAELCEWFNRPPQIDLRINPLRCTLEQVEAAMQAVDIAVSRVPGCPQALRLPTGVGSIQALPGFAEGWWTVQDSSAQLVSHVLDPQPGEVVIDACAAPGGKTTHIAELMHDQGMIWACDRHASRLKKLKQNCDRLQLKSIQLCTGDSRQLPQFVEKADRVLVDAPCSGLGTLHRHADARWRQTPDSVRELAELQKELLTQAATWVKPGGVLVYATCTLHPLENEAIVQQFLSRHPNWQISSSDRFANALDAQTLDRFATEAGWFKVLPHRHQMDGFFLVRFQSSTIAE